MTAECCVCYPWLTELQLNVGFAATRYRCWDEFQNDIYDILKLLRQAYIYKYLIQNNISNYKDASSTLTCPKGASRTCPGTGAALPQPCPRCYSTCGEESNLNGCWVEICGVGWSQGLLYCRPAWVWGSKRLTSCQIFSRPISLIIGLSWNVYELF